jgi:hypothetical protein
MRRYITLSFALLIALTVVASSAYSQDSQLLYIRALIEHTDDIIEQAKHVVASTSHTATRSALGAASTLQNSAWDWYYKASDELDPTRQSNSLAQAKKLTLEARDQAQGAIAAFRASQISEQSETVLLRKLEQLSDMVDRAGENWGNDPTSTRGSVMESVRSNLERAWEFYRNGQYRLSLGLCNQVDQTVRRIITAGNVTQRDENQFERRAEFVRRGIERVEGHLANCSAPAAPALIERAREALELANQMAADGKPQRAMNALQNARKLTEEAARMCRGQQSLTDRYDRLLAETERISERVRPGDEHGRRMLRLIYEQLELATGYLESENSASATAALKAASLTLAQLKRHISDSGI